MGMNRTHAVNVLVLVAVMLLSVSSGQQTFTTTTTTSDGTTRTKVTDGSGNVLSDTYTTAAPAGGPLTTSTSTSPAPSTSAAPATSAPPTSSTTLPTPTPTPTPTGANGSTSTIDGGPMTIDTQTPQASQTQAPQATPAPQTPQTQSPQATPAPQTPETPAASTTTPNPTTATPKPTTATPKPTPATPAETTATPQPSSSKPASETPSGSGSLPEPASSTPAPATTEPSKKKTEAPTTSMAPGTSAAPATSAAPGTSAAPAASAAPATTETPSVTTAKTPDAKPATVGPASDGSSTTNSHEDAPTSNSSTPAPSAANPLSEGSDSISNGSGKSGSGGGSWGMVVTVAGVICAIVGVSAYALVSRRRKMMDQDDKSDRDMSSNNLDFESGITPADGRAPHNAAAVAVAAHHMSTAPPPPAAALSPPRQSYEFRRASNPHVRAGAMATPVDTASMRQSRATPFVGSGGYHVAPANGSILATRVSASSLFSRSSRASSNASFVSSASVAPPAPKPNSFEETGSDSPEVIDEAAASFHPTDSFIMAMQAHDAMSNSVVSSNMEYEFGDDSSFHAVPARRGTVVDAIARAGSTGSQKRESDSSAFHVDIIAAAQSVEPPKGSYDFDIDVLSDDELDHDDEQVDFDTDSQKDSFTQTFYEQRDDSYSDDYARGSDAGSAIRGSNDSLFSRSSSEFGERKTDDSLA